MTAVNNRKNVVPNVEILSINLYRCVFYKIIPVSVEATTPSEIETATTKDTPDAVKPKGLKISAYATPKQNYVPCIIPKITNRSI